MWSREVCERNVKHGRAAQSCLWSGSRRHAAAARIYARGRVLLDMRILEGEGTPRGAGGIYRNVATAVRRGGPSSKQGFVPLLEGQK